MWLVEGAAEARDWGWQTEEGYGIVDLQLEAWTTMAALKKKGKKWVGDLADRS